MSGQTFSDGTHSIDGSADIPAYQFGFLPGTLCETAVFAESVLEALYPCADGLHGTAQLVVLLFSLHHRALGVPQAD